MKKLLAVICCVLMSITVSFAQQPSSHDRAVAELIQVLGVEHQMRTMAETMTDAMLKGNPALAQLREPILQWFQKYFTWDVMGPEVMKVYKDSFTEAEVRDMLAFYKTPTGQKVLLKLPEITQQGVAMGSKIGQAHSGELQDMIKAKLQELQDKKRP
jgi:hypothetical protein